MSYSIQEEQMNNYKKMFKELIEGLSDYTFFELKGWLAHNFADVTDGFDEDFDEEYLDKLREYINYSIQGQELIIHLNAINIGVYDEINEMMNMSLQDLLL